MRAKNAVSASVTPIVKSSANVPVTLALASSVTPRFVPLVPRLSGTSASVRVVRY